METLLQDLQYAARATLRNRRFSAVVVLTLALAIGANTVIFSAMKALVLDPFGFRTGDRVVALLEHAEQCQRCDVAPGNFVAWREQSTAFRELAAYRGRPAHLTGTETAERVRAYSVTPGLFAVLGAEFEAGAPPATARGTDERRVVISHGLWQRRFGGDPAVVGRELTVDGEPYTVAGILRRHHEFPAGAELWTPLDLTAERDNRLARHLGVVGRLRDDVSIAAARAELATIAQRLAAEHPATNRGWGVEVERFADWTVEGPRPYVTLLLGAVAFLLLIACTNVANLMFAQASTRTRELAVRTALGAGRGRIVRQLLTESLLLALLAGGLGVALAVWGLELLRTSIPPELAAFLAGWDGLRLDRGVLAFTVVVSLGVGIGCGLVPALGLSRPDLTSALKDGGRGSTGGARAGRLRRGLVVSQVALALVLLAGTALMAQSFVRLIHADPGFRAENVLTLQLSLTGAASTERAEVVALYERIRERVAALPGVEAAALAGSLPMSRSGGSQYFNVEGRPELPAGEAPAAGYRLISRDYPAVMGVPLLRGRAVRATDRADAPRVVLINESFAHRHFAGQDPVGQRLLFRGQSHEIVGVLGDVRHFGPRQLAGPELFVPHAQAPFSSMALLLRSDTPPAQLAGAVRAEIAAIDRDVGIAEVRTMERVIADFLAPERVTTAQMTVFALLALLIAAVGIYGLMSYSVLQRTHEIGVRTALGARSADVLALLLRQGLRLTAIGVALGLLGAVALTRLMTSLLYGVTAYDPATLIGATALLGAVALLSCYLPARRAARVDPMVALRSE